MSDANADCMPAPAGAEHEKLHPFVGKFKAEVKMWMGPGDPMVSTGTMVNTMDLQGRFLCHDYKGDPSEGPFPDFAGRGFWGFNDMSGKYEGVWVDTASNAMQTETGSVDESGKVWTMSGELISPQGGTVVKRSVITLVDNDHHRMEMFFVVGENSSKGMEINYKRIA